MRGRRFPRSMRLKASRDFAQVKQQGNRLVKGCLILNWQLVPAGHSSRLGVITSRRLGSAVVRNRARRLLREVFRLNQDQLAQPLTLVLVARPSIVGRGLRQVEKDFLEALRQAHLLKTDE